MSEAIEVNTKTVGETYLVSANYQGKLDVGELLTGTPTAVELTTSELTISSVAVNTSELTISGRTVAIGQAVQYAVSGGTAGSTYKITTTASTTSTPAGVKKLTMTLKVVADDK